jgi:uncharacterized protein YndB with AHSA1/START domain
MSGAEEDFGTITEAGSIRFERLLPGPIERVWAWLTQSEKRSRWLASGEMDLRPGGEFELVWRNSKLTSNDDPPPPPHAGQEEYRMRGEIIRVDPPRLLVQTWNESDGTVSQVSFELAERQDEVLLTLTHSRLSNRSLLIDVAGGWHTHLLILQAKLQGREPPPFWATHKDIEAAYQERVPAR